MTATCNCTGNKALDPFFPFVVEAGQTITNTNGSVEKLAVCNFWADRAMYSFPKGLLSEIDILVSSADSFNILKI